MSVLKIRGLIFDEFTRNEDGSYWSQMCKDCQVKYKGLLSDLYDDHGGGACGIEGCDTGDADDTSYIDFPKKEVEIIK